MLRMQCEERWKDKICKYGRSEGAVIKILPPFPFLFSINPINQRKGLSS